MWAPHYHEGCSDQSLLIYKSPDLMEDVRGAGELTDALRPPASIRPGWLAVTRTFGRRIEVAADPAPLQGDPRRPDDR
jgi:hypothetical protein